MILYGIRHKVTQELLAITSRFHKISDDEYQYITFLIHGSQRNRFEYHIPWLCSEQSRAENVWRQEDIDDEKLGTHEFPRYYDTRIGPDDCEVIRVEVSMKEND